jgi:hypothetical protein
MLSAALVSYKNAARQEQSYQKIIFVAAMRGSFPAMGVKGTAQKEYPHH